MDSLSSHSLFEGFPKHRRGNWTFFNWANWTIGLSTTIQTWVISTTIHFFFTHAHSLDWVSFNPSGVNELLINRCLPLIGSKFTGIYYIIAAPFPLLLCSSLSSEAHWYLSHHLGQTVCPQKPQESNELFKFKYSTHHQPNSKNLSKSMDIHPPNSKTCLSLEAFQWQPSQQRL